MKVQAKITSSHQLPNGTFRFYLEFESDKRGWPQHLDVTIPDPPPEKSDGQKAYETHPLASRPWDRVSTKDRNTWHMIAAAVTGKAPALESEPAPVKTPGERLRSIAHPSWMYDPERSWSELTDCERNIWEQYARLYEASK